ncbi:MAG TPA: ribbon-helix-helix protein, CopG family [Chloroflexota bacterium]|nr:ribbon-helix-helix protein, CopG family [Chloroflexota bacterium]
MSVRRQVYLGENEDRALADESRRTGRSMSQLIRWAIEHCYGSGRRRSCDEAGALAVRLRAIPSPDDRFADDLETIQASQPLAGKPEWRS